MVIGLEMGVDHRMNVAELTALLFCSGAAWGMPCGTLSGQILQGLTILNVDEY